MPNPRLHITPYQPHALAPAQMVEPTFNFALALPGHASSRHTERAYFRWIDQYLVDVAGLNPTSGDARQQRMSALSVRVLQASLSAAQLRAWLGILVRADHGKQGVQQARAAVVTLASLLAEAELLDEYTSATIARVRPPKAEEGQRPGRWLSPEQIRQLISASREIATSDNQRLRNHVITGILCTMALRRDELAAARWSDLSVQNDRPVLRVRGKGRKTAIIDIPRPVLAVIDRWHDLLLRAGEFDPGSALVRRMVKGGRIGKRGISPDGIWLVVGEAAEYAGLGHVAPHDLRRSVAGALHEGGVPIDKISKLLRHSNIAVTERYLNRLPKANEGALLMSDLLGLDGEWGEDG
jgi:integrase